MSSHRVNDALSSFSYAFKNDYHWKDDAVKKKRLNTLFSVLSKPVCILFFNGKSVTFAKESAYENKSISSKFAKTLGIAASIALLPLTMICFLSTAGKYLTDNKKRIQLNLTNAQQGKCCLKVMPDIDKILDKPLTFGAINDIEYIENEDSFKSRQKIQAMLKQIIVKANQNITINADEIIRLRDELSKLPNTKKLKKPGQGGEAPLHVISALLKVIEGPSQIFSPHLENKIFKAFPEFLVRKEVNVNVFDTSETLVIKDIHNQEKTYKLVGFSTVNRAEHAIAYLKSECGKWVEFDDSNKTVKENFDLGSLELAVRFYVPVENEKVIPKIPLIDTAGIDNPTKDSCAFNSVLQALKVIPRIETLLKEPLNLRAGELLEHLQQRQKVQQLLIELMQKLQYSTKIDGNEISCLRNEMSLLNNLAPQRAHVKANGFESQHAIIENLVYAIDSLKRYIENYFEYETLDSLPNHLIIMRLFFPIRHELKLKDTKGNEKSYRLVSLTKQSHGHSTAILKNENNEWIGFDDDKKFKIENIPTQASNTDIPFSFYIANS